MAAISLVCRTATPFNPDGSLDESGLRAFLQQFIDARIGVVLGSSGTGEGYALPPSDLKRLFEIGVETCKGKVQVYANPPEQHTARVTNELQTIAASAGVDKIVVFPLAGWHGMKPSEDELRSYYDSVLGTATRPVALAVNSLVGYTPKIKIIADVINKYSQIEDIFLTGLPDTYFLSLKPHVERKVSYFTQLTGAVNMLTLGATGVFATEANVLPKTYRRYIDLLERGDIQAAAADYSDIKKMISYMEPWGHSNARWIKMYMYVMKMPGGTGGLREPYKLPPPKELEVFTKGFLALNIPEVNEQAKAAGLR